MNDELKPKSVEYIPMRELERRLQKRLSIMMEKVTMSRISETKELVKFLCRTTNAIVESVKDDGKITIKDLFKFGGAVTSLFPAIAGITNIPSELQDLDETERDELQSIVKEELNLSNNVEQVIELSLVIAADLKKLINIVKTLKKNDVES